MSRRATRLLTLAATLACAALLAAETAAAAPLTPARYRSQLNSLCSGFAPEFAAAEHALSGAQNSKDGQAYLAAVGRLLYLSIDEDTGIESVPVPAAISPLVSPALHGLERGDHYLRTALGDAIMGDNTDMLSELGKMTPLGTPFDKALAQAGLASCGSNRA